MLDQDQDEIVSRDDISRSLGNSCTDEEIDAMFAQLGCTSGRLFFNDLNRMRAGAPSPMGGPWFATPPPWLMCCPTIVPADRILARGQG